MAAAPRPAAPLAAVLCAVLLAASCAAHAHVDTRAPAAAPRRLLQAAPPPASASASASASTNAGTSDLFFERRGRGFLAAGDAERAAAPRGGGGGGDPTADALFSASPATTASGTARRRLAGQDVGAKDVFEFVRALGDKVEKARHADLSCGSRRTTEVLARDAFSFRALPAGYS
jgi:hypothetical protein